MRANRIGLAAGMTVLLITGCQDTLPVDPEIAAGPPIGGTFDWSMPARFGADNDGDGQTDYLRTTEEISPATWRVDFDACALTQSDRATYRWYVNKHPVGSVATCTWSYQFPAEGQYEVKLQLIPRGGPPVFSEQVVTVQDFLVVSFGDSYASGQGVPEVPGANQALIASLEATAASFGEAQQHLADVQQHVADAQQHVADAQASLAAAIASRGLAQSILTTHQNRLNSFLAACADVDSWAEVAECAAFLAGLPFDTFQTARNHFIQARNNAQAALNDAIDAVNSAQAAVNSAQAAFSSAQAAFAAAQAAVQNLKAALAQIQAGLKEAEWQKPYPGENWDGEDCNRSANAAPARAARALENADPRTSVTFVHLACTGAMIDKGRAKLDQQTTWAAALVGTREVDAVLMSIGGNDAGFASIAQACTIQQLCYDTPAIDPTSFGVTTLCSMLGFVSSDFGLQCTKYFTDFFGQSAADIVSAGVTALPAKYAMVAGVMLPRLQGLPSQNRVYITEYVDMTRDDSQNYCEASLSNVLGAMPGIILSEMQWLDVNASASINQAVAGAAGTHGWNAVQGIHAAYRSHGYCASNHWVVRLYESLLNQGTVSGIAHPNNAGHAFNGSMIFASLMSDLYPGGIAAGPRPPQ